MAHTPYTWTPYPCTGSANFESVARSSLQSNMENNMGEETRLFAIEDWSAFNPGTMPGTLIQDGTVKATKFDANNSPFDGYVATYNNATGQISWQDMAGVIGADTYQVKWTGADGAAFLADFIATKVEAESGTVTDKLMTPERTAGAINALLPAGMLVPFPQDSAPDGWFVCDGREIDRTVDNRLFAVIGTMYGVGDGSTSFNLPDLRGRFLRGFDDTTNEPAANLDPDKLTRTDRGDGTVGDNIGTEQGYAVQGHSHPSSAYINSHALSVTKSTGDVKEVAAAGSATGLNDGSETRPVNINVLYCIKR